MKSCIENLCNEKVEEISLQVEQELSYINDNSGIARPISIDKAEKLATISLQ